MSSLPPVINLGLFLNDVYQKTSNLFGELNGCIVTKLNSTSSRNPVLKNVLDKIEANKNFILRGINFLGVYYNYSKNPLAFSSGVLCGFFASFSKYSLGNLTNNELLNTKSENSYFSNKMIVVLSAMNAMSKISSPFSFATGFMIGNSMYHEVKPEVESEFSN